MPIHSAGLLLYRLSGPQVLLVHPGGPYFAKKDEGAWSIPKGLIEKGEDPLVAAQREFAEETGFAPAGTYTPLGAYRQPGGKIVEAWAIEGDFDPNNLKCNTFTLEWPPHSGKMQMFPEVDRAAWFSIEVATRRILKGQRVLLHRLVEILPGQS